MNINHVNSEGERISIESRNLRGKDVLCLVIHDDPPPRGTGQRAPMLLDEGTRNWLMEQLSLQAKCTCHPDDNPPVPCAEKYALQECKGIA